MWSVVFAVLMIVGGVPEQGKQSADSCRRFVSGFYAWYVKATKNSGFETALKKRPSVFSAELLKRLKEDRAAQARRPNEMVGLDFDPFLNAQDMAQKYAVGRVTRSGRRWRAEVFGLWNGRKNPAPDVVPELTYERGRWVFVNFHYDEASNLLKVLAELRRERKEGKSP